MDSWNLEQVGSGGNRKEGKGEALLPLAVSDKCLNGDKF